MSTLPSAAASATAEPDISENSMLEAVVVMARPARIQPTTRAAKSVSRCEIPDAFMSAPARMNSGIAISGNESVPLNILSGTTTSGVSVVSQIASAEAAMST